MHLYTFKIIICYAGDIDLLLSADCRNALLELRANQTFFSKLKDGFDKAPNANGSFHAQGDEGFPIRERIKRSLEIGGKNIYTPQFFTEHVPVWFTEDLNTDLSSIVKKSCGQVINEGDLEIDAFNPSKALCRYDGAEMRLFRDGTFSIRFDFSSVGLSIDEAFFSVDEFINILRQLEKHTFIAFKEKIGHVSRHWAEEQHPVAQSTGLTFKECDLSSSTSNTSQVRPYRIVLIDTLYEKDPQSQGQWTKLPIEKLEGRQLLGILNVAPWYTLYSSNYVSQSIAKNIGYKDNELLLCDGNASLIVIDDYFTTLRLQNYMSHLFLLSELLNSQLTYLLALIELLDTGIIYQPPSEDYSKQPTLTNAILMKALIMQMEKAGEIDSLVSHGYSRKYLSRVRDELHISERTAALYRRMEAIDKRLTLESEQQLALHGFSLDTRSLRLATVALVFTAGVASLTLFVTFCNLVFQAGQFFLTVWNIFNSNS